MDNLQCVMCVIAERMAEQGFVHKLVFSRHTRMYIGKKRTWFLYEEIDAALQGCFHIGCYAADFHAVHQFFGANAHNVHQHLTGDKPYSCNRSPCTALYVIYPPERFTVLV